MQIKHIIGATGFFSLGALVAWAVTADRYELKVNEAYLFGYVGADTAPTLKPFRPDDLKVADVETEDPNQSPLPFQDLEVYALSLDEEPNAFGGTAEFVDPQPELENAEGDDEIPEGETPEQTRENLQRIIDNYTANPQDRDEFVNQAVRATSDNKLPYVITRDEYAWGEDTDSYAKITLSYYPRDRVLLDDDNDLIDDVNAMIGWRSLSNFGNESGDPNVVFVRNDRLLSDFEVVREEEAELPLHIKYGISEEEFKTRKAAGLLQQPREDE